MVSFAIGRRKGHFLFFRENLGSCRCNSFLFSLSLLEGTQMSGICRVLRWFCRVHLGRCIPAWQRGATAGSGRGQIPDFSVLAKTQGGRKSNPLFFSHLVPVEPWV